MSRLRSSLLRRALSAAAIALLLLVAAAVWISEAATVRRWATARVAAALGPAVHFTALRVSVWPPPFTLTLADVRLLAADGSVAARAQRVRARVRLRSALSGRGPLLAALRVEGAEAELVRNADGSLALGTRPLTDGALAPTTGDDTSRDAALPRLEVRDSRVLLRDAADARRVAHLAHLTATLVPTRPGARLTFAAESPQLGPVRAEASIARLAAWQRAPGQARIELPAVASDTLTAWLPPAAAPFAAAGQLSATLALDGTLAAGHLQAALRLADGTARWGTAAEVRAPLDLVLAGTWGDDTPARLHGTVEAAGLRAAGVDASALQADLTLDDAGLTIRDAAWSAFGAHWRQDGSVRLGATPVVSGRITADAVDGAALTAALQAAFGTPAAPLRVDGTLQVTLHADDAAPDAPLRATVALAQPAGTLAWGSVRARSPLAARGLVSLAGTTVAVDDAEVEAAAVAGTDLEATAVRASGAWRDGALRIDSLTARAFDGHWQASGTLPLTAGGAPSGTLRAAGIDAARLAHALLTGARDAPATAGDVDLDATLTAGRGTLTLRLASAALTIGSAAIRGPASVRAALAVTGGTPRVNDGQVQIAAARLGDVAISDVRAQVASAAGSDALTVAPFSANALGSAWTGELRLARALVEGTVRSTRVDFDRLLAALAAGGRGRRATGPLQVTLRKPRDGAATAAVDVQLVSGTYAYEDLTVTAPARGTATVHVDGDRWQVTDLVASAAAAAYPPLRGTVVSGRLGFDADALRAEALRFAAGGGQWQWAGTIGFADPATVDGTLTLTGTDPAAVLAMVGFDPGALDIEALDLHAQVRGRLAADWQRDLSGSGQLMLRGGTITSTGVLQAIVDTVAPHRRTRPLGTPNRLISLREDFTLGGGALHTTNLSLLSDDYDLTARGTVSLDGRLALDGHITLTQHGIQRLFVLGAVPLPPRLLSLPTIPARFEGTLAHPHIRPDPTALAGSTARWFAEALLGAPLRLGEAVTHPLSEVVRGMRKLVRPAAPPTPGA